MEITISEGLRHRIQCKVDTGKNGSPDEVVERALDLPGQRDIVVWSVKDMVQESIDDFEAGRYKTYSKENRDDLLTGIKALALKIEAERMQKRYA